MSQKTLSPSQSTYLDALRAIAALSVLFGHASVVFLNGSLLSSLHIQNLGVFLFFLLSGFLISYSVFRKHTDPNYGFRDYFIDRFCRIYCAFLPALIFVYVVDEFLLTQPLTVPLAQVDTLKWIVNLPHNATITNWVGNLVMLQDFPLFQVARRVGIESATFITPYGSAPPFWTIAIEWWIYMLFGFVAIKYIKEKSSFKFWHVPLIGALLIVPGYNAVAGADQCLTLLWMLGMFACYLFLNARHEILSKKKLRSISAVIFSLSSAFMVVRLVAIKLNGYGSFLEFQFGFFLAVSVFSLLYLFGTFSTVPKLAKKTFWFVAEYSFSLYLVHNTVLTYLYVKFPDHNQGSEIFWVAIILSNLIAIVFWWLFERHHRAIAQSIKSTLEKGRKATPA